MYKITITIDSQAPRALWLKEGSYSVGREYGCDILVAADSVSRRHARLTLGGDGISLEDLQSTAGTFAAGGRIEGVVQLKCPCSFAVGPIQIDVKVASGGGALSQTAKPESEATPEARAEGHHHFVIGEEIAKGGDGRHSASHGSESGTGGGDQGDS